MSVNTIMDELEEIQRKLDKLLARGTPILPVEPKEVLTVTEKVVIKGGKTVEKEFDKSPIIWTEHDGKKFKACRYKCGNYVSWDETAKKYLHYDAGFKLIGHECPKYAIPTEEEFKDE